jgi:hypothetical protein
MNQYVWTNPGILTAWEGSVRLTSLYIENIIYLFYKRNYFNMEVNSTKPSPQLAFPASPVIYDVII